MFSPEFRNRLDAIVTFRSLTPAAMESIVEKFVLQLEGQLAERHVAITLTPEARAWLATKGLRSGVRRAAARRAWCRKKCATRSPTRSCLERSRTAAP